MSASDTVKKMRAFNAFQKKAKEAGEPGFRCKDHLSTRLKAYYGKGGAVVIRCPRCRLEHDVDEELYYPCA